MNEKKFNNRENTAHNINGKIVWESRSAAVVAVVMLMTQDNVYVLGEKRSAKMDSPGKWSLPCGYMDWDEDGWDAVRREIYEETTLDINDYHIYFNNNQQPFFVNTKPSENRQNIALSYVLVLDSAYNKKDSLLEVEKHTNPEVDEIKWIQVSDIHNFDWAFSHDKRIHQAIKYFFDDERL